MRILVTGASGFVGGALVNRLTAIKDITVVACSRRPCSGLAPQVTPLVVTHYDAPELAPALSGVDVVVHAAARAHVLRDDSADPLEAFREANVRLTSRLARQAAAQQVKRFVYLSSIGVNGDSTTRPFTERDEPAPAGDYARAKLEAELALAEIAAVEGIEAVVVRPPLVHGRDAPGNFARLVRLAGSGMPLPFAGIHNRRSLVGIDNLCDFLITTAHHPAAANETFLVSDAKDISTEDLVTTLRHGMGLAPRLFPFPHKPMQTILTGAGRGRMARQLYGDLQVSHEKAHARLGWRPPYDTIESLMAAVNRDHGRLS